MSIKNAVKDYISNKVDNENVWTSEVMVKIRQLHKNLNPNKLLNGFKNKCALMTKFYFLHP